MSGDKESTHRLTVVNTSWNDGEPIVVAGRVLQPGDVLDVKLEMGEDRTLRALACSAGADPKPYATAAPPHAQVVPVARVQWLPTGVGIPEGRAYSPVGTPDTPPEAEPEEQHKAETDHETGG